VGAASKHPEKKPIRDEARKTPPHECVDLADASVSTRMSRAMATLIAALTAGPNVTAKLVPVLGVVPAASPSEALAGPLDLTLSEMPSVLA
jgi:hypothetical protein